MVCTKFFIFFAAFFRLLKYAFFTKILALNSNCFTAYLKWDRDFFIAFYKHGQCTIGQKSNTF